MAGLPASVAPIAHSESGLPIGVQVIGGYPLGRMAQPDEIARAAVFLASESAGFVTGQTLHVNGGSYLA